ncbi:N-acetylmuramoyl-L-alanine amidase [Mycolicibacterium komossense]|uniref:N-acetylmuramoyl-L-alanine amidase n=1 Tax=Mycolicibacterium komossense TaxID=1779 RepID=A0ABT3CN49_9MYCO|nr:N-acetylmuramoyl-L-alanine amidase [Mycolicibacterium komossense]MCV7230656.1 N-acetylmuramoyl-L-alanine amidase [Mycolicibacterium komossense]
MTSKDQVAQLIVSEAKARNHTRDECLAEMSALYQESQWDETVWGPQGKKITYGVAQQDSSYPNRFQGAAAQVKAFFDKLDVKRTSPGHGDIWLNICWLQQAPNWPSTQYWWDHGRQAYLTEIKSRIATVTPYLDKYWPTGGITVPSKIITVPRPDFNEIDQIFMDLVNGSFQHASARSRVPINFFLHTEQPPGTGLGPTYDSAATDLAAYLRGSSGSSAVSYHYCVRQATDGGVTVVDVVDTDYYCWAVLNANVFSINLCFAGSKVEWTRQQWMTQSKAIDVAAYLAVQDAYKYGFSIEVIPPPYAGAARAGISDHRYVTKVLGYGTHTDVGDNFPWDYFIARVNYYTSNAPVITQPADTTPLPAPIWPKGAGDRELLEYIAAQLGPGDPLWTSKDRTLRDKLWDVATKVGV